jgi:hypothetical protein
MEEMLEDTLDMDEDEELEDEADAEVDQVLFELTNGKLGEAGSISTELPVRTTVIRVYLFVAHKIRSQPKISLRTKKRIGIWKNTASN